MSFDIFGPNGSDSNGFVNPIRIAKGNNPDYFIDIRCFSKGLHIVADMPESLMIGVSSEWENQFPLSSIDDVPGVSAAKPFLGSSAVVQRATEQIWQGTSPIEIPVTLLFDAETDAKSEVNDPMATLETLVLPEIVGGELLVSPGPITGGKGSPVSITLGKFLKIPDAICTSVSNTYKNRLDKRGYAISGQSEVNFRAPRVYSSQDWIAARGIGRSSNGL